MPPYQNMHQNIQGIPNNIPNKNVPVNMNVNSINQKAPMSYQNSFPSTPYQNVSFPSSHPFNAWKRDDVPLMPNPSWWQNNQQTPQQNYRPDYPLNYNPSFSGNVSANYMQQGKFDFFIGQ